MFPFMIFVFRLFIYLQRYFFIYSKKQDRQMNAASTFLIFYLL